MARISTRTVFKAYLETYRPSKWLIASMLVLLVFLAYWSSSYVAVGEPYQVRGFLRSVEPPHGGDTLFSGYKFELADGQTVTIFLPVTTAVKIDYGAVIEVQPHLLGGKSHRFMGYEDEIRSKY